MPESDGCSDEEGRLEAYFPDDFKQYVDTQLNRCPVVYDDYGEHMFCGWVFWSQEDDQSEHPPNILDLKKKIKDVLPNCLDCMFGYPTLLQFWAPTMTMDGRSYLTTQNQPFGLYTSDSRIDDDVKGHVKGLCGYRMISKDYKFYMDRESSDEQLGVPGRVFNHGFPEFTPNVEYYSIKEYPLRDHALRCQLKPSWAIPLFDPSTHLCVGVLEIVSTAPSKKFPFSCGIYLLDLHDCLEEVGLESSISHADHRTDLNLSQRIALKEISLVLEEVREVHGLHFAHVWAPCRVDWTCRALVKGDIFHVILKLDEDYYSQLTMDKVEHHLRKGQGVVGRAFYSPNVLLCNDVTQFSIIDYPLAHHARADGLGCCFAICLQSSHTRNDIYVLECFMPPSNKDYGNQQTALRKILETMKKIFCTFKLASGEELGEHLCIEEISQEKGKTKMQKRVHNKTGVKIEIPLEDILQNSKKSIQVAADNLKVSRSTLKRVCRDYGFPTWPPCKKNMVGPASATVVDANPHNTVIGDANIVTVKAKYINNIIIKFCLSLPAGLVELQQQIANRLHVEDGTYYVRYKDDDDDLILITCDQDLQDYVSISTSLGSATIMVLIDPK